MASYQIDYARAADTELRRIAPQFIRRIVAPYPGSPLSPPTTVEEARRWGQRIYGLRVGEYRVIYEVDVRSRVITVMHIRYRRDAYRSL